MLRSLAHPQAPWAYSGGPSAGLLRRACSGGRTRAGGGHLTVNILIFEILILEILDFPNFWVGWGIPKCNL